MKIYIKKFIQKVLHPHPKHLEMTFIDHNGEAHVFKKRRMRHIIKFLKWG